MDLVNATAGSQHDSVWPPRFGADAAQDAVHGVRILLKQPGFTAIALLVFATGIGAATAIVSVADALFVRPLAVRQLDRVMTLWQRNRDTGRGELDVAPGNALDWVSRARSFEAAAIAEAYTFNLNFAGREPEYVNAARVSELFFDVLGTSALHGRTFLPEEYRRGGARVAVFSHALWRSRFGSDPSIVGTTVRLEPGEAYTVVGIMPPGLELRLFHDSSGARRPETAIWLPKQGFDEGDRNLRGGGFWNVIGRLRQGVSTEQAQSELDSISAQLSREYPQTNARIVAEVVPLRAHLVGTLRRVLPFLFGAAAILLTVSCANVANLLLARGAARGREFALRHALGASRVRLVRQLLVESLLLAIAGGTLGLVMARRTLDIIARLRPAEIALLDHIPIDGRAALIACSITVAAALIAGLAPALQLSRPDAVNALREGRSSQRRSITSLIAIMQIAAALVLVLGAGLLVRSFVHIQRVDPGFSRDDVSVIQVFASPRIETPPKRIAFFQLVVDRMGALPGVVAVGAVTSMPFGEARVIVRGPLTVVGRPVASGNEALAYTSAVTGDYFRAMSVPLLAGRLFDGTDTATSRQVALVSQSAARQFWQGSSPLRSKVRFRYYGKPYEAEVVGVVGDVRHETLDGPAAAEVYLPYAQSGSAGLTFVVRTAPGAPANLQTLEEQIWALDPLQSIYSANRLQQLISKTLTGPRFNLFVLGGFAVATLLLAVAGLYGVTSFSTSQRTREFGIRMALGAARGDVVGLVLRDGLKLAGAGVAVGTAVGLVFTRFLRSLLFGVSVTDPTTFLIANLGIALVAIAACYLPARRALKIDPVDALRVE